MYSGLLLALMLTSPFRYHAGGGPAGLEGFFSNIGGTVHDCWEAGDRAQVSMASGSEEDTKTGTSWKSTIFGATREAYGMVTKEDLLDRDRRTKERLGVLR